MERKILHDKKRAPEKNAKHHQFIYFRKHVHRALYNYLLLSLPPPRMLVGLEPAPGMVACQLEVHLSLSLDLLFGE